MDQQEVAKTKPAQVFDIISNKGGRLFFILGGFFVANTLCAEFMGVKIFSLEHSLGLQQVHWKIFGSEYNFDLTAGVLLWPVVFIMTDIINEYYGHKGVNFLSWLVAGFIAYAYFMFFSSISLQPAPWWPSSQMSKGVTDMNASYSSVFGQSNSIIIASLLAFLLGQFVDVAIFHQIKKVTGEKYLWLRSTGSTLFSQLIDTFVVTSLAFYFIPRWFPGTGQTPWSLQQLFTVSSGGYLYKFIVAIGMTPVIYLVHNIIEKYLGHDLAKRMKDHAANV